MTKYITAVLALIIASPAHAEKATSTFNVGITITGKPEPRKTHTEHTAQGKKGITRDKS